MRKPSPFIGDCQCVISAPVLAVAALVIGGYILAATIVDGVDEKFSIKEKAAAIAR